MEGVVSASSILPNLYDEMESNDEDQEDYTEEPTGQEDVVDDLQYDLYNLLTCNFHPLRVQENENLEDVIRNDAQRSTQLLIEKLMKLPTENSDIGPLVVLPSETAKLPRATKLIQEKIETKWEKFAREKGIKNKKRERMVFDEQTEEFKPRYGYKRIKNGIEDIPIIEVKTGQDPFADPWEASRKEKKERVKKNEKNQKRNIGRAEKIRNGGKNYDPESIPGIPLGLEGNKKLRGKAGVRKALQLAQGSTASLGRFDEMRKGEPERKLKGKKRSFRDNMNISTDKDSMFQQIRIVADKADKKKRGVTNSLASYEGIIPDAPTDSFRKKKGKGKEVSTIGKKKKSSK